MAKCAFCGKETSFGKQLSITRSHISKRSTRTVKPNLRTVKAVVDGKVKEFQYVLNAYVLEKLKELFNLKSYIKK